ncbi:hypothetical protein M4A92_15740 [Caldibacillus thermoamylovorans]|uniref:hypothetical protein n=1 Tax=Caldibacillus thermoamylovorans TaxID=35841 RepID=UPI00203F0FBE|nr:hypothetical protein [Caldibacillus thermoamylovorans]MCM3800047.1 hypothetical protein [Caldibacillus thermoamylovorans]
MTLMNTDVRFAIRAAGLTQWKVAEKLGISEATFTRKLRKELSPEEKQHIFNVINELKGTVIA